MFVYWWWLDDALDDRQVAGSWSAWAQPDDTNAFAR